MKRRSFIKDSAVTVFGVTAFGAINWNGKEFVGDSITTTDILGPFYRPGAPMRSNLVPAGVNAPIFHLSGTVYDVSGKKPLPGVLVEIWHCDQQEHYDNISDDYNYRGSLMTDKQGKYSFRTNTPVPYADGPDWRTAHIHMRVSSNNYQDLVTQIYFEGDPYVKTDAASSNPASAKRIMHITKNKANESEVVFDVVMGESYKLDNAAYKKITGIYKLENGYAEFSREDDLLMLKLNSRIEEALVYKGNNTFEGGLHFNKARFEILLNGDVKTYITMWDVPADQRYLENHEGLKILNYSK